MNVENNKNIFRLIHFDVKNLYQRITERKIEYVRAISLKRTRKHLEEIFKSRYYGVSLEILQQYPEETIILLEEFYKHVDELKWYLEHTEEMTQMMTDRVNAVTAKLDNLYQPLEMQLAEFIKSDQDEDVELEPHQAPPTLPSLPIDENLS